MDRTRLDAFDDGFFRQQVALSTTDQLRIEDAVRI